jgi:hypothetical protein
MAKSHHENQQNRSVDSDVLVMPATAVQCAWLVQTCAMS